MKAVSFNVNSVRVRLHQLEAVITKYQPEVIGLQETKVTDEDFPLEAIESLGYHAAFTGQKTHYGVALLTKSPMTNVQTGFPGDTDESQKRFVSADIEVNGTRVKVANGYFPQGESRKHETKFPAKAAFYVELLAFLQRECDSNQPTLIMGDMNVAPLDLDIGIGEANMKRWLKDGKTSFLPEEREWLEQLIQWGLFDTYRHVAPEADDLFSWFDYRSRGFEREPKRGLRIDLILATEVLRSKLLNAGIDYEIRGMDKPSDHCPIYAEFDL
ncbi:MAG: exodeoxyribonuclease-3 [Candidatus Azotimanducaceae bacterium]|jgi:exodeoxyribonuclease-3